MFTLDRIPARFTYRWITKVIRLRFRSDRLNYPKIASQEFPESGENLAMVSPRLLMFFTGLKTVDSTLTAYRFEPVFASDEPKYPL
jgi:hypothetical protein